VDHRAADRDDALSAFGEGDRTWDSGLFRQCSRALIKAGPGARIACGFVAIFGRRTPGIGYALALSELTIAPVTPGNKARGGAILHPIMRAIADGFDSDPKVGTEERIGKYAAQVNHHANSIKSAMFITPTAPDPLIVKRVAEATGAKISISWGMWRWRCCCRAWSRCC
jgi:DASS family divalent anion:Na+ symporter